MTEQQIRHLKKMVHTLTVDNEAKADACSTLLDANDALQKEVGQLKQIISAKQNVLLGIQESVNGHLEAEAELNSRPAGRASLDRGRGEPTGAFGMTERKLTRNSCRCLQCGEELVSRSRHDFVMCHCANQTFTDGGLDYVRRGGMDLSLIEDTSEYEDER